MKRFLLLCLVVVACSGQSCGINASSGQRNICGRGWFNATYRIAINPPAGANAPKAGELTEGIDSKTDWEWPASQPPVQFSVVVFQQSTETLDDYRQAWLDELQSNGQVTLLNESTVTLSDGAQGWYLAFSPVSAPNIIQEFVMTVTQYRLVYVTAMYGTDVVTQDQVEAIGDVLHSLCADLE